MLSLKESYMTDGLDIGLFANNCSVDHTAREININV